MNRMSPSRPCAAARIASIVGALFVMVGASSPVAALAADDAGSQPPVPELIAQDPGPHGYFEYALAPGERRDGTVSIHNRSTVPATFALYATDASTSTATGVIYGGLGAKVIAGGTWLKLAETSLNLGPDETRTVPFVITVPPDAGPGDHVAGIAAQNPTSTAQHGGAINATDVGVALDVSTRVVTAVVVHVPGPAAAGLSIGAPALHAENGNRQVIEIPMNATGQLLMKPHLTATLHACGQGGGALAHLDRPLDTFVPATSIVYQWPLGTLVLQPGCYTLDASATLGPTELSRVNGNLSVNAAQAAVHPVTGSTAGPASSSARHPARHNSTMIVLGALAVAIPVLLLVLALRRSRRRRRELETEIARLAGQAWATANIRAH